MITWWIVAFFSSFVLSANNSYWSQVRWAVSTCLQSALAKARSLPPSQKINKLKKIWYLDRSPSNDSSHLSAVTAFPSPWCWASVVRLCCTPPFLVVCWAPVKQAPGTQVGTVELAAPSTTASSYGAIPRAWQARDSKQSKQLAASKSNHSSKAVMLSLSIALLDIPSVAIFHSKAF